MRPLGIFSAGLIVLGIFVVIALVGGTWFPVAIVRIAAVVFTTAAIVESVVNMVRHCDLSVRSRFLGLLGGPKHVYFFEAASKTINLPNGCLAFAAEIANRTIKRRLTMHRVFCSLA